MTPVLKLLHVVFGQGVCEFRNVVLSQAMTSAVGKQYFSNYFYYKLSGKQLFEVV